MGDVVNLNKKRDENKLILVCRCGCRSWTIYADGGLACCSCGLGASADGKVWLQEVDTENLEIKDNVNFSTNVVEYRNDKLAVKSLIDSVDYSQLNTIVAFQNDGHIQHWTNLKTDEQFEWLKKSFDEAYRIERQKSRPD